MTKTEIRREQNRLLDILAVKPGSELPGQKAVVPVADLLILQAVRRGDTEVLSAFWQAYLKNLWVVHVLPESVRDWLRDRDKQMVLPGSKVLGRGFGGDADDFKRFRRGSLGLLVSAAELYCARNSAASPLWTTLDERHPEVSMLMQDKEGSYSVWGKRMNSGKYGVTVYAVCDRFLYTRCMMWTAGDDSLRRHMRSTASLDHLRVLKHSIHCRDTLKGRDTGACETVLRGNQWLPVSELPL